MDFSSIPLFSVMKAKLNYSSERQGILAQNIANVDTPGYHAKDINAPDFKQVAKAAGDNLLSKLPMTITDPKHVVALTAQEHFKIEDRPTTDELNPDKNNVSVEEEMMKVAQNQTEYQKAISLYKKMIGLFNTAVGHNGASS